MNINCTDFIICPMKLEDLNEVYDINIKSLKSPWSLGSLNDEFSNTLSYYVVCKNSSKKVVGFGGMWLVCGEGNITNIAVHPNFRHMGIGSKIVTELCNICTKNNCSDLTLEVRISNTPAIKLYEKIGFKNEGIRKNFYSNPTEDAIIMWKHNL